MKNTTNWYAKLKNPKWAPPSWVFGPVWTFLYILIAISFISAFILFFQKQLAFIVILPFILNIIFNFSFTPIQFGLKNNWLAAIDIVLILGTLIWLIIAIFPLVSWIAYIQAPYLIWVMIATTLQFTVTYLNRK